MAHLIEGTYVKWPRMIMLVWQLFVSAPKLIQIDLK